MIGDLAPAALLAVLAAGIAFWARALSASGAVGAALVGFATFGMGGAAWGALLITFFVSSSILTRWQAAAKSVAASEFQKGGERDFGQVMANGGIPGTLAVLQFSAPSLDLFPLLVGALAVATADTWATELGLLSRTAPRLLTTGQRVEPGRSGAITPLGVGASLAGGTLIGTVATLSVELGWLRVQTSIGPLAYLPLAMAAALVGSLLDSLLGATLQRVYHCPACEVETERPMHRCGVPTEPVRGIGFLDNDRVNLIAIISGALAGWAAGQFLA